jgi:hypothetical protein
VAIITRNEVGAHEEQDDVSRFNVSVDLLVPLLSGADEPGMPPADHVLLHQSREVFLKLVAVRFVLGRIRKEDMEGGHDPPGCSMDGLPSIHGAPSGVRFSCGGVHTADSITAAMRRQLLLLCLFSAAGCMPSSTSSGIPSSISGSGYSASLGSAAFSGSDLPVPQRGAVKADLVVRPDMIIIEFALREVDADPQKAVAAVQATAADVAARLKQATSGAASMKMCGTSVAPVSSGKADDDATEYAVTVDGSIEVRLTPELDYWARSRLLAAIAQVTKGFAEAARAAKERRGANFQAPRVAVKDPEAYRAKLSERWVERARAFAAAAQAGAAPLHLLDCAPPGEIEQRPISLEEIGLSLAVSCRLDALRADK